MSFWLFNLCALVKRTCSDVPRSSGKNLNSVLLFVFAGGPLPSSTVYSHFHFLPPRTASHSIQKELREGWPLDVALFLALYSCNTRQTRVFTEKQHDCSSLCRLLPHHMQLTWPDSFAPIDTERNGSSKGLRKTGVLLRYRIQIPWRSAYINASEQAYSTSINQIGH